MFLFKSKPRSANQLLDRLLDELTDEQVSLLLTGDCWDLREDCLCRTFDRFALQLRGLADEHGHLTELGLTAQAALIDG